MSDFLLFLMLHKSHAAGLSQRVWTEAIPINNAFRFFGLLSVGIVD